MNKIKVAFFSIIFILILSFIYFISYNILEPKVYDYFVKNVLIQKLPFHNKQVHGHDDIVLVVIDDKTVEKYRWPWKRNLNCKIYNYFNEYAKPAILVHDSLFTSSDINNPQSDKEFFNTLKKTNNVILGFLPLTKPFDNKQNEDYFDKHFPKYAINAEDYSTSTNLLFSSILPMPHEFMNSVKHFGSVYILSGFINGNITFAKDEIYRNQIYLIKYKDHVYPSLAMETFLLKNNNPSLKINNKYMYFPELNYKVKHKTTLFYSYIPVKYYKFYPYTSYSHKYYSAVDIMNSYDNLKKGKPPIIDPKEFKDKIVVFGANVVAGEGLNDNKNSPVSPKHAGVDLQATAIDNLVHNDFLNILPNWFNVLVSIIGMVCIYAFIRFYDVSKALYYVLLLFLSFNVMGIICFYFDTVIAIITPNIMFVMITIYAFINKFILENISKEKVKYAMGKYMSQDVMKRIVMNIDNLGLGGKKSTVTVLFSDIRGFTSMSETMSAEQVSEILNEYFTEMEPIVTKYNGIINKFIGDAVMAIFGEPIQDNNHPANAVKCGYEMLQKVKELQKKWVNEGKPKIDIGIGINTGEVFVGNIGSVNRMEYTVIGDTVNLASRLESYNKIYKTKMLISSSTYQETKNILDVIKISDVEIRGKSHKMDIYEVLKVIE